MSLHQASHKTQVKVLYLNASWISQCTLWMPTYFKNIITVEMDASINWISHTICFKILKNFSQNTLSSLIFEEFFKFKFFVFEGFKVSASLVRQRFLFILHCKPKHNFFLSFSLSFFLSWSLVVFEGQNSVSFNPRARTKWETSPPPFSPPHSR